MNKNGILLPSIAVAGSGAIWGLYWIPIRKLDAIGLAASWTSLISFSVVGVLFLSFFLIQWFRTGRMPWGILFTGLLTGSCVVFYAVALSLTEVVKTVLLFYLTPVWSTILGKILLREQITRYRITAIVVGLAGLAVILELFEGMPDQFNFGDFLALMSGVVWAYATVRIRDDTKAAVWEHVGGFYIGGAISSVFFILLPVSGLDRVPSPQVLADSLFWLTIFIVAYLPSIFLIIWGAQILSPARVGILMMTEIIFGVTSASLLSGEPFGWTQAIGITLIMGAATIDVSDRFFTASVDGENSRN